MHGEMMERTALVFGGGGARGAFGLGVAKYVRERGNNDKAFRFDIVIGNSCGALIAGIYYGDLFREVTEAYLNMRKRDVMRLSLMGLLLRRGLYDSSPLRCLIEKYIPEERLHGGRGILVVVGVDVKSGRLVALSNQENAGSMQRSLYHSALIPVLCAPEKCGRMVLGDGGYRAVLPLQVATDMGATKILAVSVSPSSFGTVRSRLGGPLQLMGRWIELLCGQGERDQVRLARAELDGIPPRSCRDSRVKLILPYDVSMPDPPDFDPDRAHELYVSGQQMAAEVLDKVSTPWEAECYNFRDG